MHVWNQCQTIWKRFFTKTSTQTAALDPLSEYEVYSKFDEIADGKTTIYISHRLASCRFCDQIAVFHMGELSKKEPMRNSWLIVTVNIMNFGTPRHNTIQRKHISYRKPRAGSTEQAISYLNCHFKYFSYM